MYDTILGYGLNIAAALVILLIGFWAAKFARNLSGTVMERRQVDPILSSFFSTFLYTAILVLVVIAALANVGVQTASLIVVVGAAGLAIGLSLQGTLSNFASGIMIIALRQFKVGDYIEAGPNAGIVEEIHLFYSRLRSPDNKEVIIPNAQITGSTIINHSARAERRVDMVFGVAYDSDLDDVRRIFRELIEADERVLPEPEPVIVVGELADSSINFWVRPWVKTADLWAFKWDFTEAVKKRFDQEGINIPFPQNDVHLFQAA
jgi:small conductance mechanosensitive channel